MKKKILLISLCVGALAFAQKAYITGDLPVKVEERTLFYFGDGLEVSSADATVHNQGNIQVAGGDFKVINNGDKDNFWLYWQEDGTSYNNEGVNTDMGYGQLIIKSSVPVESMSKIRIDRQVPGDNIIETVPTGFPFTRDDTPVSIIDHPDNTGFYFTNNSNRLHHPLYRWNNNLMRFDRKFKDDGVYFQDYHIIRNYGGMQGYNPSNSEAIRTHIGTPRNTNRTLVFPDHSSLPDFTLNSSVNAYNEVYRSYIDEYYETHMDIVGQSDRWGKNGYQYGNPYTSNLDLSYIGIDEDTAGAFYDENGNLTEDPGEALNDGNVINGLIGVYKFTSGHAVNPVYGLEPNQFGVTMVNADSNGVFISGDKNTLIVKPMEAFVIKTNVNGVGQQIKFNDGLKTFSYRARAESVENPNASTPLTYRTPVELTNNDFNSEYYQIRLNLHDDTSFINRTYVIANSNLNNGAGSILESNNVDLNKGIYTKQELSEGEGLDVTDQLKYYINAINTDYLGTPIPLFIENLSNEEQFVIDFDLCLGINDLPEDQLSYANSDAKYYFHDIYLDTYFEIFNDSFYEFTKTQGDGTEAGERFELFYGSMGENLGNEDIQSPVETTIVYKNDKDYLVKFDNTWSNANIFVYTAVGQLVYMKEKVSTDTDFLLPLNKANITAYIVKIENPETGESVSKKIVK